MLCLNGVFFMYKFIGGKGDCIALYNQPKDYINTVLQRLLKDGMHL